MDGKISPGQREELMDQVKQQIVIANTQELLTVRYFIQVFSYCS